MNASTQTSDHVSIQRLLDVLGILDSTEEEEVTYTLISGNDEAAAEKKKDHPRASGDLSKENKKRALSAPFFCQRRRWGHNHIIHGGRKKCK